MLSGQGRWSPDSLNHQPVTSYGPKAARVPVCFPPTAPRPQTPPPGLPGALFPAKRSPCWWIGTWGVAGSTSPAQVTKLVPGWGWASEAAGLRDKNAGGGGEGLCLWPPTAPGPPLPLPPPRTPDPSPSGQERWLVQCWSQGHRWLGVGQSEGQTQGWECWRLSSRRGALSGRRRVPAFSTVASRIFCGGRREAEV